MFFILMPEQSSTKKKLVELTEFEMTGLSDI